MPTYPLFRVSRSHDGQRWEPLSDADTRALFDELARRWDLIDEPQPLEGTPRRVFGTPSELVAEVIHRLEAGEAVEIRLNQTRSLYLMRAEPRQFSAPVDASGTGPGDYFHRIA